MDENQNETKDMFLYSCSKISLHYDMLCCHQCQRGRLLDQLINCVLSLMLHKMSYQFQSVYVKLTQAVKTIFCVYQAFMCLPSSEGSVYRVHSGDKEKCTENEC